LFCVCVCFFFKKNDRFIFFTFFCVFIFILCATHSHTSLSLSLFSLCSYSIEWRSGNMPAWQEAFDLFTVKMLLYERRNYNKATLQFNYLLRHLSTYACVFVCVRVRLWPQIFVAISLRACSCSLFFFFFFCPRRNFPAVFAVFVQNLSVMDERCAEAWHARFRSAIGCDLAASQGPDSAIKRVMELVVELCDPSALVNLGLTREPEHTSNTRLVHLLSRGVAFFGSLLTQLVQQLGSSVLVDSAQVVCGNASASAPVVTPVSDPLASAMAWQQHVESLHTCQQQRALWERGLPCNSSSYDGGVRGMRAALLEARLVPVLSDRCTLPAPADCNGWQLQCHLIAVGASHISGTKEQLLERLQPAARAVDAADEAARAEAESAAQRKRWVLQTPLFGALGVRSLPLGFRTQATPLSHSRICVAPLCPHSAQPVALLPTRTMACGCRYHPACLPPTGVCEPCRGWLAAEVERNSAVRCGTISGVAADLASDTLASERDDADLVVDGDDDDDANHVLNGSFGVRATQIELRTVSDAVGTFRALCACMHD
jgi:hypothetical protein